MTPKQIESDETTRACAEIRNKTWEDSVAETYKSKTKSDESERFS